MVKWIKGTFALFIFLAVSIQEVSCQLPDNARLKEHMQQAFSQTDLKAVNFGYVTRGGNRFDLNLGSAAWEEQVELTGDHIFRIASMTKAITSVALLQLFEQGKLDLDEPAGKYLPEIDSLPLLSDQGQLQQPAVPVTVRHLLTHTSGFGYSFMDQRLQAFGRPAQWPHADLPRLEEAGTRWIYGTGTNWVGRLVEHISGMDLESYLRTHITGPLQMDHTWFNVPDSLHHLIVSTGRRTEAGIAEQPGRAPARAESSYNGGGGLFSSLNDYLTFLECILNEGSLNGQQILRKQSVELMFADQLPKLLPRENQHHHGHSVAWAIQYQDNDYGRKKGSAYWSGILNSYYSIDINTGIAVVTMANILPFPDQQVLNLYKEFEKRVRMEEE